MNVLLYVMDALRPDFLSTYGFGRPTSPSIDALADDGVKYTNTYATTSWTKASAASIVTGRHPREINMMHRANQLPGGIQSLGETLSDFGMTTHAISANSFFSPAFGFTSFDEFDALQLDEDIQSRRRVVRGESDIPDDISAQLNVDELVLPTSQDINDRAIPLLDGSDDTFVLAWSADTHGPYFLRGDEPYFGSSPDDFYAEADVSPDNVDDVTDLYSEMIRYNDEQLGNLIEALKDSGVYEDTLIIVTADHGESFCEHNSWLGKPLVGHTGPLYEEVIRVPLVIKYPYNRRSGETCASPTQLIDIFPTIADVCGIDISNVDLSGQSLATDDPPTERSIFAEAQVTPEKTYSGALRQGEHKLLRIEPPSSGSSIRAVVRRILAEILLPESKLFDLTTDPDEMIERSDDVPNITRRMVEEFEDIRASLKESSAQHPSQQSDVTQTTKDHLRAMGYYQDDQ